MTVSNSTFFGNHAAYGAAGGGIYNQNSGVSATVTNTIIANSTRPRRVQQKTHPLPLSECSQEFGNSQRR
jgi:hypothetical protein